MHLGASDGTEVVHGGFGGGDPHHAFHVGDGDEERSVGIAGTEEGIDLEHRATGIAGVDARAVVDDPLEDRQRPDPHATMLA